MTPASSYDDRELVRQLVESASLDEVRVAELQTEVLLRLDAAARPVPDVVSASEILRANGALAAKLEVLAVLAELVVNSEKEAPGVAAGTTAALVAVAGMK